MMSFPFFSFFAYLLMSIPQSNHVYCHLHGYAKASEIFSYRKINSVESLVFSAFMFTFASRKNR